MSVLHTRAWRHRYRVGHASRGTSTHMSVFRPKTLALVMSLAALCLALAATASAQGFYYKEIEKDGRIYVFNNAAEAARFEKTGESGVALTRPGAGPKGETVIGDSERALQLYFFKHGISEVVPEPAQPTMRVEWRDGKTRITTDNAYLEISNRVQPRWTQEIPPPNITLAGTEGAGEQKGSFRIRRAKMKLEGWFWRQNLTYEVQLNWPALNSTTAGGAASALEDANIAWDPQGVGKFRVLFGQFKVASFRQQLTSSGSQQFVDRSNVSDQYARGRDAGVAVQGVLFANKLEYRAGIFNGNGLTQTGNDNDTYQYNARLMWQPNGNQNLVQRGWVSGALYSEADFESTTVPLYALAINFESNDFYRSAGNPLAVSSALANTKALIVSGDGIFKFKGFSTTGEYFWRQRQTPTLVAANVNRIFKSNGWYLQGGKMLDLARQWEVVARYGWREGNDLVANDDVDEMRVGLNYYYRRHNLKFQVDAGQLETGLGSTPGIRKDRELRAQAQFIF